MLSDHPESAGAARDCVQAWAEAFNTREPARIVALYAQDALLLGTSQGRLYRGQDEISGYFRGTSTVAIGEMQTMALAPDTGLAVGHYVFTRAEDGRPTRARFTFVVRRTDGVWRILHHHSSAEPA